MENGMQMIYGRSGEAIPRRQTAGASGHRASHSASQESGQGLKGNQDLFGRYFASCGKRGKNIDLNGLSMKTLRECFQAAEDLTTLPYSLKWMSWGMTLNGSFSTARIGAYPRTGNVSILLDILEDAVPEKYFLSREKMEQIVFL